MGRYLAIADQALSETNNQSDVSRKTNTPTHRVKSELSEISPTDVADPVMESVDDWSKRFRENPDELKRHAGDDSEEVFNDPAQLVAFADSLAIVQIRELGKVPDHYTATIECIHCGPVPIFEGLPETVKGCPWCFNRIEGLPIPHKSGDDLL